MFFYNNLLANVLFKSVIALSRETYDPSIPNGVLYIHYHKTIFQHIHLIINSKIKITMKNLKKNVVLALCILGIVSCEKAETDTEIQNIEKQENFMSTTGNSDTTVADDQSKVIQPMFHMHFGPEVSEEEGHAKFDKAIAKYFNNNSKLDVDGTGTTFLNYIVQTRTGTYEDSGSHHCGTDGSVRIHIDFRTDLGYIHQNNIVLNNPGNDREGGWDVYYLRLKPTKNGNLVNWIEIPSAGISLKGKDGWYLRTVNVFLGSYINSSSNFAALHSRPEMWLDNNTNNGWDFFYTNSSDTTVETGRYNL